MLERSVSAFCTLNHANLVNSLILLLTKIFVDTLDQIILLEQMERLKRDHSRSTSC